MGGEKLKYGGYEPVTEERLAEIDHASLTPLRQVSMPTIALRSMVAEIREHRAAALTPADIDTLRSLRYRLGKQFVYSDDEEYREAELATIDKLLAAKERT